MPTDTIFRVIFSVLFVSVIIIVGTYRRRAEAEGGHVSAAEARRREGLLIYIPLRLLGVLIWLGSPLYIIAPHLFEWSTMSLPTWARWAGVGLALTIVPFVVWAQRSLGGNVTKTVATKEAHYLVTRGPYRWVRHPLYLAGTAFFIALSLISANWYFLAALLLGVLPLMLRTRMEEAALVERFGDEYRDYMNRTGRFLPRIIQ